MEYEMQREWEGGGGEEDHLPVCRGFRECDTFWVDNPAVMDAALVGIHPENRTIGIVLWNEAMTALDKETFRPTFLMDEKATAQIIFRLQVLLREIRKLPFPPEVSS